MSSLSRIDFFEDSCIASSSSGASRASNVAGVSSSHDGNLDFLDFLPFLVFEDSSKSLVMGLDSFRMGGSLGLSRTLSATGGSFAVVANSCASVRSDVLVPLTSHDNDFDFLAFFLSFLLFGGEKSPVAGSDSARTDNISGSLSIV